jgi:hypothetical protein
MAQRLANGIANRRANHGPASGKQQRQCQPPLHKFLLATKALVVQSGCAGYAAFIDATGPNLEVRVSRANPAHQ